MHPTLILSAVSGLSAVGLMAVFAAWLLRDLEPSHVGATEDWRPKLEYRPPIRVRYPAGVAAAVHEPLTWEQRRRVFADEIAWYRRRARAIRRWTQALPVVPVERPVAPVRSYTPPEVRHG